MLSDALSLLFSCLLHFFFARFFAASSTFVLGAVAAILIVVISQIVARSFLKGVPRSVLHYLLCLFGGLVTWVAVPLFCALGYLEEAAGKSIADWKREIETDNAWSSRTFARAYEDVSRLGMEDMTNFPPPAEGGNRIPLNDPASVERYAQRYADDAAEHWRAHRLLLGRLLWTLRAPSRAAVANDVQDHFAAYPGREYPQSRAIALAAGSIETSLHAQAPQLVFWGRALFVLLVAPIQALPLLLIAWRAHRELQPAYSPQGV